MTNNDVSAEYARLLSKAMKRFDLYEIDIAFLANTSRKTIEGILELKSSVGLKTLESIAGIFGQRYFQFGDPKYPLSKYENLPDRTKTRIAFRKESGEPTPATYNKLELNERILDVLRKYQVGSIFTSRMIFDDLQPELRSSITPYKVTDRLKYISEVEQMNETEDIKGKKGRKSDYYKLIKKIS